MFPLDLSIIIPVYNVEKYILDCLRPLVAFNKLKIEIIIVNDGSLDNSIPLAVTLLSMLSISVTIINQENQGAAAARNAGLKVATGQFIYFCDSDDFIIPDEFLKLWKEAKDRDLDICSGKGMIYLDDGSIRKMKEDKALKKTAIMTGPEYFRVMDQNKEFSPCVPLRIFKRSFLSDNSIYFTKGIIHEDEEFTALCFAKARRCAYFSFDFYRYRFRSGSVSRSCEHKYLNDKSIPSFIKIAQNLIRLPAYNADEQAVLHRTVAKSLIEILRRYYYCKQENIVKVIPDWKELNLDYVIEFLPIKFRLPIYRFQVKSYLKTII